MKSYGGINMKKWQLLTILLLMFTLVSCGAKELTYQTISAITAKEMIDADDDVLILDVRTLDEYNAGHIENAVLLPNTSIGEKTESIIPNKDITILVYCRSGNRSASASVELVSMGYTNVYDFGGIIDWTYDIVTK
jgi:rhodanese-related sulfurtransferase